MELLRHVLLRRNTKRWESYVCATVLPPEGRTGCADSGTGAGGRAQGPPEAVSSLVARLRVKGSRERHHGAKEDTPVGATRRLGRPPVPETGQM